MLENFITIKDNNYTAEIVEKKSKFIANLFYVENIEQVEEKIKQVKRQYFDARHNCVAYRIVETDSVIERFSDDGEPSGTAGAPMLSILQKNNLCNVLVIVTRYFGGILLGTGGLVRAYSDATIKSMELAEKVSKCYGIEAQIEFDYSYFDTFKYYARKNGIFIRETIYEDNVKCIIQLENKDFETLKEKITNKSIIVQNLSVLDKKYISKME